MKTELVELMRCPFTGQRLHLEGSNHNWQDVKDGCLVSEDGHQRYPVKDGIPRFVEESNYADNFGMQWNHFRKTQLDSHSGLPISTNRFWKATGWSPDLIKDEWVLDAGCGAGRFAEVALLAGAKVVAVDFSSAVDACYANLKHHSNLYVVQGDIYALPFAPKTFPFVYSLGVLQHTPNVGNAFTALTRMLRDGGRLCADFYWRRFRTMIHAKYFFRPLTKRMQKSQLFELLEHWVPILLVLSQFLGRVPIVGRVLKRIVPVADYTGRFPLSEKQLKEWALLDTFDMLAPTFDNPQTAITVKQWFEDAGLIDVEVGHWSHLVGRGTKPV